MIPALVQKVEAAAEAEAGTGAFSDNDKQDIQMMAKGFRRHMQKMTQETSPTTMYEVDNDLAKTVINEDRFTRDGRQRIPVEVPGEVPVRDMMMPAPTEPSDSLAPSIAGQEEFPPMIIMLCQQDEDMSPTALQEKLADVFRVDPSRFAVTIADA